MGGGFQLVTMHVVLRSVSMALYPATETLAITKLALSASENKTNKETERQKEIYTCEMHIPIVLFSGCHCEHKSSKVQMSLCHSCCWDINYIDPVPEPLHIQLRPYPPPTSHTHTHTRARARAHTHTHKRTRARTHTHTHTHRGLAPHMLSTDDSKQTDHSVRALSEQKQTDISIPYAPLHTHTHTHRSLAPHMLSTDESKQTDH